MKYFLKDISISWNNPFLKDKIYFISENSGFDLSKYSIKYYQFNIFGFKFSLSLENELEEKYVFILGNELKLKYGNKILYDSNAYFTGDYVKYKDKITDLEIYGNRNIYQLDAISKHFNNLENIKIYKCDIDEQSFKEFLKKCEKLRYVDIASCPNISENIFNDLSENIIKKYE